jgi:hypothetical protein
LDAIVERLCQANVFLSYGDNAWVLFSIFLNNMPGIVGGTVVDDDELEVAVSLIENAFNGLMEVGFSVIDWH